MFSPGKLTDSSGGSASATAIAAATNTTALTDSGGGTADDTVAAMTAPGALTDNGGGAAADGTIGAITLTEPANLAAQTTINNQLADAVKELSTKANLANTMLGVVKDNLKEVTTQLALQRALNTVLINAVATLTAKLNALIDAAKEV